MPVEYLEHYLVQTDQIEPTVAWYRDVLGLEAGPTPNFGFPVQWMYIGKKDVIHITHGGAKVSENRKQYLGQHSQATRGSGVIDHVAFRATGLAEMMKRFEARGVKFSQRQVDRQGLYQLFLFDPNDVKVELNFEVQEARDAGISAPVSASTFKYEHVDD